MDVKTLCDLPIGTDLHLCGMATRRRLRIRHDAVNDWATGG